MTKKTQNKSLQLLVFASLFMLVSVFLSAAGKGESGNSQNGSRGGAEFGLKEAEIAKRVDAVESLIAECMRAKGFEYYPVPYKIARMAMDSNSKPSGLNAADFRKQYGYGITTLLPGKVDQGTMGLGDRNNTYRANLSPADRVAYDRALFGKNTKSTFVVCLDSEDFSTTGGCTRAAVEKVFSKDELGPGFVNYQNAASARVDQDPRIIDAYKEWAKAMRSDGYHYNNTDEIKADLLSQLDKIMNGSTDPSSLPPESQAALKELQGKEKTLAAVAHKYEVKYVDPVRKKVEAELLGPDAAQQ